MVGEVLVMKNSYRKFSVLCILAITLFFPSFAQAGTVTGLAKTINVNGISYTGQLSTITSGAQVTGKSRATASTTVGAGYIYTLVTLYNGSSIVGSAAGYTSASLAQGYSTYTTGGQVGNSYSSRGQFAGFNPITGTYTYATQYPSPSIMYYANALLNEQPNEISSKPVELVYQKTESGETFGTALGEEVFGRLPDWISAVAANGAEGYVKAEDYWMPTAENPADAVENFSTQQVRLIPVYAEPDSAEVVGQYEMYYGG